MRKCLIALAIILSMVFSTTFAFAAADPAVTIVNPASNSTVAANSLLISVKVTKPETIRINMFETKEVVNGVKKSIDVNAASSAVLKKENVKYDPIMQPESFTCKNNLSYYTKQINVNPGVYYIQVETLDSAGNVKYKTGSSVIIKESQSGASDVFDTQQSGTFQFLQTLLKSIFGN